MNLNPLGIFLRFVFALLLVLLTYNPSGFSYFHWAHETWNAITPYLAIAGLILIIGWGFYLNATLNSLGAVGIALFLALFGCIVWLLVYWGWLSVTNVSAFTWVIEVLLAMFLTIGMCWSHFTRRMSGQVDVDEMES